MFHAVVLNADDPANPDHLFPGGEELAESMMKISSSRMAEWIPEERRPAIEVREIRERGFSAATMILDYATEQGVDLIITGTHGRRGPARMFLGSVAERIIRYAQCPVLSLRESETPREISAFEQILVPVDFSECSPTAVAYGKELADLYGASVQLLHVIHESTYPSVYGVPSQLRVENLEIRCLEAMDKLIADVPGPEVPFEKHIARGRVANEITSFAHSSGTDLIVIPSHGFTGIERALLGSTVEGVVRRVNCPVLTVKPHGKSLLNNDT
jgi:nucleotide-binding universal stress UspA family protein